jgi:hypothetical protein
MFSEFSKVLKSIKKESSKLEKSKILKDFIINNKLS